MKKLIVLILMCTAGFASAHNENETLYMQCKIMQDWKKNPAQTGGDAVNATACLSFIAGAYEAFTWSRDDIKNQCKFDARSNIDVINDYLNFTKKNGLLKEPSGLALNQLFENCYCHDNPALEKITCGK